MTAREDPWIGQPTKIEAPRLEATVHLSAADHKLISISRDFVPPDGAPRRRPRPHVREERGVAVDEQPALRRRKTVGQMTDVGSSASAEIEDVQWMVAADRVDDFTRQQ